MRGLKDPQGVFIGGLCRVTGEAERLRAELEEMEAEAQAMIGAAFDGGEVARVALLDFIDRYCETQRLYVREVISCGLEALGGGIGPTLDFLGYIQGEG